MPLSAITKQCDFYFISRGINIEIHIAQIIINSAAVAFKYQLNKSPLKTGIISALKARPG
jgi:hypothetical protein